MIENATIENDPDYPRYAATCEALGCEPIELDLEEEAR